MFILALEKVATTYASISPEEYYDLAREKDPYVGALTGSHLGAAVGALKGKKGSRSKAALVGAALGSVTGGTAGHVGGKLLRRYQSGRIRRLANELNLRSTPTKHRYGEEEK